MISLKCYKGRSINERPLLSMLDMVRRASLYRGPGVELFVVSMPA